MVRTTTSAKVRRKQDPFKPGRASDYIEPIDRLQRGDRVIIVCRESWNQGEATNRKLAAQERRLRRAVEKRGGVVADVVKKQTSGWYTEWLREAVVKAQDGRASVLVALTRNRLLRKSKSDPTGIPCVNDYMTLGMEVCGLRLMTVTDPDATEGEQASYLTKLGQRTTNRKGGRPASTKETRDRQWDELKELVLEFRRDTYWTNNKIARLAMRWAERHGFKVARRTVYNWCSQGRSECAISSPGSDGKA